MSVTPKPSVKLVADDDWEEEVWQLLEKQYGVSRMPGARLIRSGKKRIRLISNEAFLQVFTVPCVGPAGLYIGEYSPRSVRLSMDGAILLGRTARKQFIELSAEQANVWLQGETIQMEVKEKGYVIVKHKDDILGCGSLSNGQLLSFVPKTRRIRTE